MEIRELNIKVEIERNKTFKKRYSTFVKLLKELRKKEIPAEIVEMINNEVELINSTHEPNKSLSKQIRRSTMNIVRLVEKKLKIAPKNLYRTRWMVLGMSFGVSIGVALGVSMDNMGFLAIGIGVGMVLGMAIGAGMDKKANEEGRQLDVEIKY